MRSQAVAVAAAVLAWVSGAVLSATPAAAGDTPSPVCTQHMGAFPQGPATLVSSAPVTGSGGRAFDLTLQSPALGAQTHVDVLLPKHYDPSGATRYPVLYLLHGAAGTYKDWLGASTGNAQQIIDDATTANGLPPFIAVIPDAGVWGFYTDWYGQDLTGDPNPVPGWATYHVHELVPFIDASYPTVASRSARAVAGLSMGGFGATSYGARFPDIFSVVGSFSGADDNDLDYPEGNIYLDSLAPIFSGGKLQRCVWGDYLTQDVHWRGNNPTYLAPGLGSTALYIASGGGDMGTPAQLASDPIEEHTYLMSKSLISQLDARGIKHTDDFYGAGSHAWSFWQTDLRKFLPWMFNQFPALPPAPPAVPFAYRSIQPTFSAWGWSFTAQRDVTEFTYLEGVSASGLIATGSGRLGVVTAPLYAAGAAYTVRQGSAASTVVADAAGRLSFTVDLGPSHQSEQTAFDPPAIASWTSVPVTIRTGPAAGSAAGVDSGSAGSPSVLPYTAAPQHPAPPSGLVLLSAAGASALLAAGSARWRRRRRLRS